MSEEKPENLLDVNMEQMETGDLEDGKSYKEKQKKYILKGISSIFSAIIHSCSYYSVFILGHTVVYLISFRRHYNPNLTFSHGYFLFPIMNLSLSLTITIGGIIEKKIGGKKTIFLSSLVLCLSFAVMYFSRNLFLDYILMGFIGFGIAIGIKLDKRNACSYFMNKKALISGIVTLVPSFVSAGLAIFYEKHILNPLSESPTIEHSYYEERIFLNFQKLIIYEIGFLILVCVLSLVTFFKNDPKETIKYGFGEKVDENKSKEIEKRKESFENQELKKSQIQKALYSSRSIKLFLMIFLFFPTINFINNTWRPIGIYYKIRTHSLQLVGAFWSITCCLSSIIFSLIGDKIQFRYIFCSLGILLTVTSFAFPLSFHYEVLFILEILAVAFSLNGFNVIIDPHLMKVFGMENFVEICGVIRSSSGIAEIFSVILAFYLENYFTGSKDHAYKWMYFISGFSGLISFVLGLFESDEKFDYNS
jgi:MFS family permease